MPHLDPRDGDEFEGAVFHADDGQVSHDATDLVIRFLGESSDANEGRETVVMSLDSAARLAERMQMAVAEARGERLSGVTAALFGEGTRRIWDTPEEDAAWAHL